MVSADLIKSKVLEVGFSCCGIARCRNLTEHKYFLNNWLSLGYHSALGYMSKYEDIRTDPSALLDGAKTVIVCAVNYKNDTIFEVGESGDPKIASYALAIDYHVTIKQMLAAVVSALVEHNPDMRARTFTDTAPLLEKAWAVEAGLGWIGRNSLLITPQYGSLVLLGEILIDDTVDCYDSPTIENRCGTCRLCVEACPNGAIVSDKVIDTGRCISRLTIEKREVKTTAESADTDPATDPATNPTTGSATGFFIGSATGSATGLSTSLSAGSTTCLATDPTTDSARSSDKLHGWIFGCDVCQRCCPHNARSPLCVNPDFVPIVDSRLLTREFWLRADAATFKTMFGRTPIYRTTLEAIQERVILLSLHD